MLTALELIDLDVVPSYSDAWKAVMKWPQPSIMHPPISIDFADPDQPTEVCLLVRLPLPQSPYLPHTPTNPAHLHWSIRWCLGKDRRHDYPYERIIELERAAPVLQHLTNWGPVTKFIRPETATETLRIPIATLTLKGRQTLERLALTQPVNDPDGVWNCQHWIADILARATNTGDPVTKAFDSPLISAEEMTIALERARNLK